jgi:hypothetical protein
VAPHEKKEVEKYSIVFGGNPEPIFANTASFIEFNITSKNKPVEELEPILVISSAGKKLQLFPTQKYHDPGWYHDRVFFTEKGTYGVEIEFTHKGEKITASFPLKVIPATYFPHEP